LLLYGKKESHSLVIIDRYTLLLLVRLQENAKGGVAVDSQLLSPKCKGVFKCRSTYKAKRRRRSPLKKGV